MSKWFSYNWKLNNIPAGFSVDLSYAENPQVLYGHTTLIYLVCSAKNESGFSHGEHRYLDKILKKSIRLLGENTCYVGNILLPSKCYYYYYTDDPRLLVALFGMCTSESKMKLECSKAEEPDFATYFRQLCPDEAKYQTHNNRLYIDQMKKRGDDLSVPRRISMHLCFPSLGQADPFLSQAKQAGFAIGHIDCNEAYQLPYSVILHAISPLTSESLDAITTKAISIAQKNAGVFNRLDSDYIPVRKHL